MAIETTPGADRTQPVGGGPGGGAAARPWWMKPAVHTGLIGAVLATGVAGMLGAIAGYFGKVADRGVVVLIDLLLVLPSFLIVAVLSPLFRGKTWLIFVVLLAAFQWMLTARVVRGLTQSLREREFVSAARFMGVPGWKIIGRHILPNMASFLIIDATINVSSLILAEVALSWVTNRSGVTATILGARTTGQLRTNLAAADLHLSAAETAALDAASDPLPPDYPYGELGVDQRDRTLGWAV